MALMNMVSSNINQWTVLAAMIPLVYGYSGLRHHGVWLDFRFDGPQRLEILLTLLQSGLAMMVLANMEFDWRDATVLFVLWLVQFLQPGLREVVRSEEHTSELQSPCNLVCRLLLEKKKKKY